MAANETPTVWVPMCCGRVMRFNTFKQPDGGAYGVIVCTICNKNIQLEQEVSSALKAYGEGAGIIGILGTPRPPKEDRRKTRAPAADASSDEPTL